MEQGTVLVTGGTGYIAGFCIARLIQDGVRVRTTARSLKRAPDLQATFRGIEVIEADLMADAGWAKATEGCTHVLHVASPLPLQNPKNDDELVRPARDGALRVLNAARDAGVRRVVMTSSTAAVAYGHGSRTTPWTEQDWSSPDDRTDSSAYERSKMIAERAAWDWLAKEGGGLELVTVCPGAVLGPLMGKDYSASLDIVKKLLDGSLPGLPRFGWPLVDVRDIADLHVRAMHAPAAAGERYIGGSEFFWMADIAAMLRAGDPGLGKRVPKRTLPDWLIRLSALFDPVVRDRLFELGKQRPVTSEKARRELGWLPRPVAETVRDTAESLRTAGIVKA